MEEPPLLHRIPPPRKVALVRASRLGDFVCATPAFRALRRALPGAELTLIGLPFVEPLARRLDSIQRFVPFPGWPGIAEQLFEPVVVARFFQAMQRERFDLAIQMHGSGVHANPFTLMLGARTTAGFVRPEDGPGWLDAALPVPEHLHEIDRLLALVAFLGAPPAGLATECPLLPADVDEAGRAVGDAPDPLVAVHPGARERTKRWPPERFAAAAERLRAEWGGTVVLVSGSEDSELAREVEGRMSGGVLNLAGRLSLPATAAVLARSSVLLANDSGPAHLAYAVGTPSVTVFGGTEPWRWGGRAPERHLATWHPIACRPCQGDACPAAFACLSLVTVDEVVRAAALAARPSRRPL